MMAPRTLQRLLFIFMLLALFHVGHTLAEDGIPDNCENRDGAYYQANIFPRYEPQNQRLVLISWTTGQDVQVVAIGLADTRILGWSVDCRYLATAVGPAESMDTVVWDITSNMRVGAVPDAHLQPHHITWGPNGYLVVETRNGAVLWNVLLTRSLCSQPRSTPRQRATSAVCAGMPSIIS